MRRIWFNHWFSQAYHFMNNLKQDDNNYLIASSVRENMVYKPIVDEYYMEPTFNTDEEYVDWCLGFCKIHKIDVFYPRRNMDVITMHADAFRAADVKLILDTNMETHALLQSKLASCKYMNEHNLCSAPKMIAATTFSEFLSAYEELKKVYGSDARICMKRDNDEGAQSFKRIFDDDVEPMYGKDVYYTDVVSLFSADEDYASNPYIVMPYMADPEVSVDCLRTNDGFIAIPRYKESSRITRIDFDEELIAFAEKIDENLKIQYPYNIQFRKLGDTWMFMEINTRMAGGSFKAMAVGCDFATLALKVAYGESIDITSLKRGFHNKCLGNIEGFVDLT